MTKQIPVDDCPAGPALDAAVAKVLGWADLVFDAYTPAGRQLCGTHPSGRGGFDGNGRMIVTRWSADIARAWELVEEAHFSIWCAGGPDKWVWGAGYWREGNLLCWSYDLDPEDCLSPMCEITSLAITRAFLKAKGVEFIEIDEVHPNA